MDLKKALNLPLFAVFVLQLFSFHLLAKVPDPTRFEQAIIKFEQQDAIKMPPKGAIVLTGSSSIARWNHEAHAALAPLTVIPRGFGGSNMNDLLYYIDRVAIKYQPRAILIYEGDNDTALTPPVPKTDILRQLQHIISNVHQVLPDTRIYLLSVKPSVSRRAVWPLAMDVSRGYQLIADTHPLVHYIDVATPLLKQNGEIMQDIFIHDDLHLNDKGNKIWGETIKAALMPIEAKYEQRLVTNMHTK
ncbi:GDSL-type esterase/lipase family protein [Paraglaciecola aquimarina]|uniref:GDSL-type esterase/lipase family protein n=1 Tax=Paraglaciecola aquimarina TaxID=1235557 RepID=A0ABU3SY47_9ALTE|nr:GDSL-type esterase/lipase family protein [Paraglaciecola aquimarina]MDU0354943.1 GDSL-type esterase/lipase family protein [Paraglaciecola aquimarina]